ncbi:hypothetical protein BC941DRAFT_471118 [Chlamydoabsidia padenii]|nr:hypothetical protein BC941DRAFT_471118 [Chlamydoabsidia padenii]
MVQLRKRLFRSKRTVNNDNDILSYHFKEQCKLQQQINTTIPSSKSLHDQPSVRVKANGVIVVKKYHPTYLPLDWVPIIISQQVDDQMEEEDNEDDDFSSDDSGTSFMQNSNAEWADAFLSAPPRRNRASDLSKKYHSHPILHQPQPHFLRCTSLPLMESLPTNQAYQWKVRLLIEDMKRLQKEGWRIKKEYQFLEQRLATFNLNTEV